MLIALKQDRERFSFTRSIGIVSFNRFDWDVSWMGYVSVCVIREIILNVFDVVKTSNLESFRFPHEIVIFNERKLLI